MFEIKKKVCVIIPARCGSISIKNKNIVLINKKPLLAHSIIAAKKTGIKDIIVSTDSSKYKKIAERFGAKVPFLRPKKISNSKSLDSDYLKHCYEWFKKKNIFIDIFIILRPTTPFRNYKDIIFALKFFIKKKLVFLRSAHKASESPFKWFRVDKKNFFKPIIGKKNVTNKIRQDFEDIYIPNGYVDILSTKYFEKKNIFGEKIYVYKTKPSLEIDNLEDLKLLRNIKDYKKL